MILSEHELRNIEGFDREEITVEDLIPAEDLEIFDPDEDEVEDSEEDDSLEVEGFDKD